MAATSTDQDKDFTLFPGQAQQTGFSQMATIAATTSASPASDQLAAQISQLNSLLSGLSRVVNGSTSGFQ